MMAGLANPVTPERCDEVCGSALLAVIDCFDRRMPRPVFLDILAHALPLFSEAIGAHTANAIAQALRAGNLTQEMMDESLIERCTTADRIRAYIALRMKEVIECAPSDATLH
jgi:hypothetical protein